MKILDILCLFTKISGYVLLAITMLFAIHLFNLNFDGDHASAEIFRKPTLILTISSFILIVIGMILDPHHRY